MRRSRIFSPAPKGMARIAHITKQSRAFHRDSQRRVLVDLWTKGPEKLQRIIEATKEYQAAHPRKLRKRRRGRNTIRN